MKRMLGVTGEAECVVSTEFGDGVRVSSLSQLQRGDSKQRVELRRKARPHSLVI